MEIFVLFIEYEIISLVTAERDTMIENLKQRGNIYTGDSVEVWKNNEKIADYYGNSGYERFMQDYGVR